MIGNIPLWRKDYRKKLYLQVRQFLHDKEGSKCELMRECMSNAKGFVNPQQISDIIDEILEERKYR